MSLNSFQSIIKRVSILYKKFYQAFHIETPFVKAAALHYFYRFSQNQPLSGKKYAITAISAFSLSSKVHYSPLSLGRIVKEIITPNNEFSHAFRDDLIFLGEKSPDLTVENFSNDYIDKLMKREMQIIVFLDFNFSVDIPYNISMIYIEKILKWHLSTNTNDYENIKKEIIHKCWTFFNDLQSLILFYQNPSEILAISCIELTFKLLDIPLIAPNGPWYIYVYPNANSNEIDQLTGQIYQLFHVIFQKAQSFRSNLPVNFNKNAFLEWISVPIIPMKNVPLIPPPPLNLLKSLITNDPSLDVCGCDHSPAFPPPELSD